jgi:cytoskeletal protein RodZ
MKKNSKKYKAKKVFPVIFMMLSLLWLTVSTPFIYAGQKEMAKQHATSAGSPLSENEQENSNPFGNSTEEKTPGSNSFSEEYLHDQHLINQFFSSGLQHHKCDDAAYYIAFHGELLVPPPNNG